MNISCTKCGESIDLTDTDFAEIICRECGQRITADHIADELEDPVAHKEIADGDNSYERGHCCECDMNESVVRTKEYALICSNCGASHEEYEKCSRCGHNNTGDMSDSPIYGCSVCGESLQP